MQEKPWQMFLFNPLNMERDDGDRLLERAGIFSRLSLHATEEEAEAAAREALRTLKEVDDTNWAACYGQPYAPRPPGKPNYYPRIKVTGRDDATD